MAILTTRVQRFFSLVFLSTTSEKSFISYKPSATVQALKICPVRPKALSKGLSSSVKSLVQLGNTFTQSGCGCLKKCLQLSILLPLPYHKLHTFPKIPQLGNKFVREAEGCRWALKTRNSAVQLWANIFLISICFFSKWLINFWSMSAPFESHT